MRLCIIYDCLYPWTIGGAERWYRLLAERMASRDHDVTYLTRDQWSPGPVPDLPGIEVVAVSGPDELYTGGRRAILPTLAFGWGVHRYLQRHGRDHDAVACASFPFFSTLAAQRFQRSGGYRLIVDWWEVWSEEYWRTYLGSALGPVGASVQRRCARIPHIARCASDLHAGRLAGLGHPGPVLPIGGIHPGATAASAVRPAGNYIAVVGRLTPDKGCGAIVPALAAARRSLPNLRVIVAGDGPGRPAIEREAKRLGLDSAIELRGFVEEREYEEIVGGALALLNPSRREGYGLSILDAACRGTPSIVAAGPDNAATSLIAPGVNGEIAPTAAAEDLASAILSVHAAGQPLRRATAAWWEANRSRLDAEDGLRRAEAALFGALPQE